MLRKTKRSKMLVTFGFLVVPIVIALASEWKINYPLESCFLFVPYLELRYSKKTIFTSTSKEVVHGKRK